MIKQKLYSFFCIILFLSEASFAQDPRLTFLSDSTKIGDEILVSLAFDHAPEAEVFFPQNPSMFGQFELVSKSNFPTVTLNKISTDSLVYHLKLFKVAPVQYLSLPVWILQKGDSIRFESNIDSLTLIQLVDENSLFAPKLQSSGSLLSVTPNKAIDKWKQYLFVVLISLLILFLIFRQNIDRQVKRYLFQKVHRNFRTEYKKLMRNETDIENLEKANKLWRQHMEWIESKPYTSYSVAEIEELNKGSQVSDALRELESSLYGGLKSKRLLLALQILLAYANERFRERFRQFKKQLKNKTL